MAFPTTTFVARVTRIVTEWAQAVNDFIYLGQITSMDYMTAAQKIDVTGQLGAVDVTTALQSALTAAITQNKPLRVLPGRYRLTAQLTGSGRVVVEGAGATITELVWDSGSTGGGGLSLTYTDAKTPARVAGLTLSTKANAVGTALKLTGPSAASATNRGAHFADVTIRGYDTATQCWLSGVEFVTCWYPSGENFTVKGKDDSGAVPFAMTSGVKFTECQAAELSNFQIFAAQDGILEAIAAGTPHGEGFNFSHFEIVGAGWGITMVVGGVTPGTSVHDGHINSYLGAIRCEEQAQTSIHNLLTYKTHYSTSDYTGFELANCQYMNIHDNIIQGSQTATGSTIGIVLTGASGNDSGHIHDNTFGDFAPTGTRVGILVGTDTQRNNIHDNSAIDTTVTVVTSVAIDAGVNNRISRNFPQFQGTLPTGATPSVANWGQGAYTLITANVGATSITNFTNGLEGQEIEIYIGEAVTTITDSATVDLQGNVSLTGNGAIMRLRLYTGGVWREVSRRTA